MPIYARTYRAYDGELRRRLRWWTVACQEWRVVRKSKLFWVLVIPTVVHTALIALYIYAIDMIASLQDHPPAEAVHELPVRDVDGTIFFNFVRMQSPLLFIVILLAGAGLICNDIRYNLLEVYFSKPLTWLDYVAGKCMTLVTIGLAFTLLPCVLFAALHLIFKPDFETFVETIQFIVRSGVFSAVFVVPCVVGTLASSALFNSRRLAAIAAFTILMVEAIFANIMAELLREETIRVFAFPVALNRLGEAVFSRPNLAVDVSWTWAAWLLLVVCVACLAIVCRTVRRAGACV